MNVSALQRHFREVAALVGAANASQKVQDDLIACAQSLTPFSDRPISELAVYLARAEKQTDAAPVPWPTGTSKKPPRVTKAPSVPKPSQTDIVDRLYRLYEAIAHTTLSDEEIARQLSTVEELKGDALLDAGARMNVLAEMKKKGVTAPEKRDKIRAAILGRRHHHERVGN